VPGARFGTVTLGDGPEESTVVPFDQVKEERLLSGSVLADPSSVTDCPQATEAGAFATAIGGELMNGELAAPMTWMLPGRLMSTGVPSRDPTSVKSNGNVPSMVRNCWAWGTTSSTMKRSDGSWPTVDATSMGIG
jgi:hypothetical protein